MRSSIKTPISSVIFAFVPKSYISWFVGTLAHIPLPWPLNILSINIFSRFYGIDTSAATSPVGHFTCIGKFFTRDIRPELRPIKGEIVSPVDGTLRLAEAVNDSAQLTQVKDWQYSLDTLLGGGERWRSFVGGAAYLLYLSPRDAHHIHVPITGTISETVHIPGKLWPVNNWAVNSVPSLFAVNERVISFIDTELGKVAVVMVGATNVGKISLAYSDLVTNSAPWKISKQTEARHPVPIPVRQGDKLGTFHLGSTVVLVTQRSLVCRSITSEESVRVAVRYGQDLASLAEC